MSEQNKNIPQDSSNFDFSDFDEPTSETLLKFSDCLEAIKQLARTNNEVTPLDLNDDSDPDAPKIDGTLDHYFIPPEKPTSHDSHFFTAQIYDAEPSVMARVSSELTVPIVYINYIDKNISMKYRQYYGEDPTLYIRTTKDRVHRESSNTPSVEGAVASLALSIAGTPGFMRYVNAIVEEQDEIHALGLDKPTEGTMKQLIAVIDSEISHREQNS